MNKMKKYLLPLVFIPSMASAETVVDVTKQVFNRTPYEVEVCTQREVSGDKTGDTLMGAIIGGAIGNNVTKNVENGGAVGALLGGMLAHNNSRAKTSPATFCVIETRYNETVSTVYSHSVVTFVYQGKTYSLNFNK